MSLKLHFDDDSQAILRGALLLLNPEMTAVESFRAIQIILSLAFCILFLSITANLFKI